MVKWEYRRELANSNTEYWLNKLGEAGWELVLKDEKYWIFKRPKQ